MNNNDLKKLILLYFKADALTPDLYTELGAEGYGAREVQVAFHALKTLGYIVRTNPYGTVAASFCITRLGRKLLKDEYGIKLPHPDGIEEPPL